MSVAFSPDGRRKRDLVVCLLRTADAANDREARRHLLRAKSILEVLSQEQPNPIDLSLMAALNHTLKEQHVRCFIVHGHDDVAKLELKNYLQNNLRLPEPVILHEAAAYGRTLVEKFEHYAREVNLVFVILSPDDMMAGSDVYRARQNVIFEMGYFYGKLGRRSGRIVLLYKGRLEFPSDVAGIAYVDITNGVEAAGEIIRREVSAAIDAV